MRQIGYAISLLLLTGLGCTEDESSNCITGTVVGYEYCTNAVLISVDARFEIGEELVYYDQSTHENVVRAPGEFGEYGTSTLFFQYHAYDSERDYHCFNRPPLLVPLFSGHSTYLPS
ncbi:MAG: hypothetical protein HC859_01195 [Bacteroidia bacterium]|nr:hypothetical protein [Bacteroidia bacterium]